MHADGTPWAMPFASPADHQRDRGRSSPCFSASPTVSSALQNAVDLLTARPVTLPLQFAYQGPADPEHPPLARGVARHPPAGRVQSALCGGAGSPRSTGCSAQRICSRAAIATASARVWARRRASTESTWLLTVLSLTWSRAAIVAFEQPCANRPSTSRSLGVSRTGSGAGDGVASCAAFLRA